MVERSLRRRNRPPHGEGNAEADHLTLFLDLKQLSVDPVDQDLAGEADLPILIRHATVRLVKITQ